MMIYQICFHNLQFKHSKIRHLKQLNKHHGAFADKSFVYLIYRIKIMQLDHITKSKECPSSDEGEDFVAESPMKPINKFSSIYLILQLI